MKLIIAVVFPQTINRIVAALENTEKFLTRLMCDHNHKAILGNL